MFVIMCFRDLALCVRRRMGEVALAVVTTRRGCVILTLDLESLVPAGSESHTDLADLQFSEDMREVISHLVRDTAVAKLLSRGSAATIQVGPCKSCRRPYMVVFRSMHAHMA